MKKTVYLPAFLGFAFLTQTSAVAGSYTPAEGTYYHHVELIVAETVPSEIALDIIGLSAERVVVVEMKDVRGARLEADVFATNELDAKTYTLMTMGKGSGKVAVKAATSSYRCDMISINGRMRVNAGLCLTEVRLYLPRSADTRVSLDGKPIYGSITTIPALKEALRAARFSSDKEEILQEFIGAFEKRVRFVTIEEVIEIMGVFGSFDALDVAEAFSGRVTDPENAEQVADHVFGFDRDKAVRALSR